MRTPLVLLVSAVPECIAPSPGAAIPARLNSAKRAPVNVFMHESIGQDVGDRSITHLVNGRLGHIVQHYSSFKHFIYSICFIYSK